MRRVPRDLSKVLLAAEADRRIAERDRVIELLAAALRVASESECVHGEEPNAGSGMTSCFDECSGCRTRWEAIPALAEYKKLIGAS